jgi:N-acetylmuramoyl-L-alanine amidase
MGIHVRYSLFFILLSVLCTAVFLALVNSKPEPRPAFTVDYIVVEHVPATVALRISEPEPVKPSEPDVDEDELQCLAKNIYHEARGESREGKLAVAWVTLNRVHSSRFPDTICKVVYQTKYSKWWKEHHNKLVPVRNQCQFSWYCDGLSDRIQLTTVEGEPIVKNVQAWAESQEVAMQAMLGITSDNTGGATFYYNPALADPYWKNHFEYTVAVGDHRFMKASY